MNREQLYINSIAAFWNWRMFNSMPDKATAMYLAILHFANQAGFPTEVHIPNSALLSIVGMDKRDLCRVRNILMQTGLIAVEKGKKGQATIYRIAAIGDIFDTNSDTNNDTNPDTNSDTNNDTNRRKTLSSNNNIYNIYPTTPNHTLIYKHSLKDKTPKEKENPSKEKEPPQPKIERYFLTLAECKDLVHGYTESKAVREAAMGWVRMRYAKKGDHRCTHRALLGALNKVRGLAKSEDAAVAIFAQSEERCWDGLFEVKP